MSPRNAAILKAQKLAALAADQPDSGEGRVATAALARLRAKWSIKDTELVAVEILRFGVDRGGEEDWRVFLLAICAEFFDCGSTHMRPQHSILFGTTEEVENSHGLYTRLADHILRAIQDYYVTPFELHSWGMSMVVTFNARLLNLRVAEGRVPVDTGKDTPGEKAPPAEAAEAIKAAAESTALAQRKQQKATEEAKAAAKGQEILPETWVLMPDAVQAANRVSLREHAAPPPDRSLAVAESAAG